MSLYEVCVHGWHNKLGGAEDRANFRAVRMLFSLAIGSYFSPYMQSISVFGKGYHFFKSIGTNYIDVPKTEPCVWSAELYCF